MEKYAVFVNEKLVKIYKTQEKALKIYYLAIYIAKKTHQNVKIQIKSTKMGIIREYTNNYEK